MGEAPRGRAGVGFSSQFAYSVGRRASAWRLRRRQALRRSRERPPYMALFRRPPRPSFASGCSGWQYRHWRREFYPADLPASRWFDYYAERFDTVEINNSFYRLPEASVFEAWRRRAPAGFLYAVKASRYLTHNKKLKDPEEPVARFFDRATHLREKLGPVLYQLPPGWSVNLERLEAFLNLLPRSRPACPGVPRPLLVFRCRFRSARLPGRRALPSRHAGVRAGAAVRGPLRLRAVSRVRRTLRREIFRRAPEDWAGWLTERLCEGRDVYAYFNNDVGGRAPRDALRLRAMLEARLPQGSGTARRPRRARRSRIACWASKRACPGSRERRT